MCGFEQWKYCPCTLSSVLLQSPSYMCKLLGTSPAKPDIQICCLHIADIEVCRLNTYLVPQYGSSSHLPSKAYLLESLVGGFGSLGKIAFNQY